MTFSPFSSPTDDPARNQWAGSDFQVGPRPDGSVALCGACRRTGTCRLGLVTEVLGPDGVVRSSLVCPEDHEGGPGVAHGGWTAGILDELLGHVPILHGTITVTATLTVDFVKPVPLARPLAAAARVTRREGSRWYIQGELLLVSSGALLARASGIWVQRDPEAHFAAHRAWLAEQEAGG